MLARLGGLLHDLCHVAFGHSIEDDLGILEAHDDNFSRFDTLWSKFDDELRRAVDGPLREALAPLIISKAKAEGKKVDPDAPPPGPYPFVHDIVGNTICADLIDYLARDHYYTGLPAKLGHRFIDGFYVTPADHRLYPQRMAILIQRGGRDRADVVSELYKYLRYRYELSERALVHHAKLAADAMVGKALEMWKDALWVDEAVQRSVAKPTSDVGVMREKADPTKAAEVDHAVQERLEHEFLKRGDDGLLEHLAEMQGSTDKRRAAIGELATRLLDRALFKTVDRSDVNIRGNAKPLYDKHGSPAARRRLEQDAARFAGLTHSWQVLVWLPGPKMRFKPAHVLVSDGDKEISKLVDRDVGARGKDLQENHRDLWGVSVFVDPAVPQTTREVLLARLGEQLGITWAKHGKLTLQEIAVREIGSQRGLSRTQERQLVMTQPAARGGDDTFASLVGMLEASADTLFGLSAPSPPKQDRTPQLFEDAPARAAKPSKRERES